MPFLLFRLSLFALFLAAVLEAYLSPTPSPSEALVASTRMQELLLFGGALVLLLLATGVRPRGGP